MKVVISFFLLSCMLFASLTKEIQTKEHALKTTKRKISGLNTKLSLLAATIQKLKKELASLDTKLQALSNTLEKMAQKKEQKVQEIAQIKQRIEFLTQRHLDLKAKLVLMISNIFSKSLLLNSLGKGEEEDLLEEEILKALQRSEKGKLQKVSKEYSDISKELQQKKALLTKLEQSIADIMEKQSELKNLKLLKAKKLKKLARQKRRYDQELETLVEQQQSLASALKRLKILQEQQVSSTKTNVKVKKYGGYKKGRSIHYRGPKTIPPLKRFVITKKYGIYKDPIYNIEIPNENIELKPLRANAKVRNVLNGKIILAKWTPHLKNVVIVKHSGNLYTIYANIDTLSPFVKKGRRIKKGYILGRVNSKLIFEVTKNNAHINPLELIKVR